MKIIIFLVVIVSLTALLSNNAYALGISPGRVTLEFEPDAEKVISFTVHNTEHKNMTVDIAVAGDYEGYIILSQKTINFTASEDSKTLNYKFRMPSALDKEGLKALVIVTESSRSQGTVGARIAVVQQLYLVSPVPLPQQEQEKQGTSSQSQAQENYSYQNMTKNLSAQQNQGVYMVLGSMGINKMAVITAIILIIILLIIIFWLFNRFKKRAKDWPRKK